MYSDCEIFLWYETKVNIKECILKKWIKRSFLKNLPDNEDIKIFLIQEHFDKKRENLDQELRVMGSDWDKNYRHNINVHNLQSNLEKVWSTSIKNLPDNEDVNIFLIQEHID